MTTVHADSIETVSMDTDGLLTDDPIHDDFDNTVVVEQNKHTVTNIKNQLSIKIVIGIAIVLLNILLTVYFLIVVIHGFLSWGDHFILNGIPTIIIILIQLVMVLTEAWHLFFHITMTIKSKKKNIDMYKHYYDKVLYEYKLLLAMFILQSITTLMYITIYITRIFTSFFNEESNVFMITYSIIVFTVYIFPWIIVCIGYIKQGS